MIAIVLALRFASASAGAAVSDQQVAPADSQRVLREARRAQERFERVRRDHLPWADGSGSDHCDEVVNSNCFTYGDPEDDWEAPDEAEEVTAARESLLTRLHGASQQIPGDRWIVGQRVRYLVEAGRHSEARRAGTDCHAEEWWCLALVGYAAHAAEDFYGAEVAYDGALDAMDAERRCEWLDLSALLPDAPRDVYRDIPCRSRVRLERRFWWIADPLYLTPGNERRSEHYSRHVYIQFETDGPGIASGRWTKAFNPWVIRYGAPAGWERIRSNSLSMQAEPQILTHYQGPTHVFEPAWTALVGLDALTPVALPLRPEAARTGYAPEYVDRFDTLRYQVAVFRTPDSVAVVAAYELTTDSMPATAPVLAGLFLASSETAPGLETQARQGASGVLALRAPERPGLLSIEAKGLDHRRAGRARFWLPVSRRDSIAISDILLLSSADTLPRNLQQAIPLARRGTSVQPGETLGLYWEVYGLPRGTVPVSVELTLVKEGAGWLKRTARTLGLAGKERPAVSVAWDDQSNQGGPASGAIAIDLGRNDPGRYTLRIEVTPQGGAAVAAEREIVIAKP